ncbi:MAG: HAD family hydrolase [Nitrospirae bacterium]|nr:MAG: HAD family hydrolase [Nitrospirota bacterium]
MQPKDRKAVEIPLRDIKYVLLDLDGTLLDRYFDDYFWEELVPEKYAIKYNISKEEAKEELFRRYKKHEKTLNWTDIDFWSKEFDIDIPLLKKQVEHLIEVHPHVEAFLTMLKEKGKKVFLVTNAHYKTLDIKLKKTKIGEYFDRIVTSFDMGIPKEDIEFWRKAEKYLSFEKDHSLLVDDTIDVLRTAKAFGIKCVVLKGMANSKRGINYSDEFPTIIDFRELMN